MNWASLGIPAKIIKVEPEGDPEPIGRCMVLCDCEALPCLHRHRAPWDKGNEVADATSVPPFYSIERHRDTSPASPAEMRAWEKWRPWTKEETCEQDR